MKRPNAWMKKFLDVMEKVQERKGMLLLDVPCNHKWYCQLRLQQVALKETMKKSKGTKLDASSEQGVVEALQIVDNVLPRETKYKTEAQDGCNGKNSNGTNGVRRNAGNGSSKEG